MEGLKVSNLSIAFGGLKAVSNFSLELGPLELKGLIGPNGAGKTTVFNLLTGVYTPDSGTMALGGVLFHGQAPYQIAKRGICRTFQNIRLFGDLSILDNVLVAYHMQRPYPIWAALLRTARFRSEEQRMREQAISILRIFNLADRADQKARNLSYGDQRRLEIARALACGPKVLLLDEPAAGLNSQEKVELMGTIRKIRDTFKVAILLIEHDMRLVMGVCERISVLDHGELIAEGEPHAIQKNNQVVEAYLGVGHA